MNKAKLIETISTQTTIHKKEVEKILDHFEQIAMEALKSGDEVTLTGFGTFSARVRNARMGVNPRNPKEKIQIPTVTVPKFKAGKNLKEFLK